jgi:lipopolysaccharide transport system ATP-binding protein
MSEDLHDLPDGLALRIRGLGKSYPRAIQLGTSVKDEFIRFATLRFLREAPVPGFTAIHPFDLDVRVGERIGILGGNGAGKSTLLKLLCRITAPTCGHAILRGQVASILEVGTGFHPDLSGRENVFLNGALLGMSMAEINARFQDIVTFAEVAEFIEAPVKHYSSGMYIRLAFSVAAHLDPDLLIVDEVLAVGDAGFREKCINRILGPGAERRTLLFVSHEMEAVRQVCTRVVVFDHGRLVHDGSVDDGIGHYLRLVGAHAHPPG